MSLANDSAPKALKASDTHLVAAATALVPALRSRSAETDTLSRLPDATIADFEQARLFDMMTPRMYGGLQCGLRTYVDVVLQIARGDGSSGWALALISTGALTMNTLYPKQVLDAVYASGGPVRTASALSAPTVKSHVVDGGIVIEEGLWHFNSGVAHAHWDLVSIPIVDREGTVIDQGSALIPTSQVTLLNNWDALGLRGSGSTSVTVKDVFVPDERIASLGNALKGEYQSAHLSGEPLYRLALVPFLAISQTLPALGIAKAALELFLARLPDRGIAGTFYLKQDDAAVTHLQLGEASAKIDTAELIVLRCADELEASAGSGTFMALDQRARIRRDAGFATKLIWEAVDLLAGASGGSFAQASNPMNRLWRDARVAGLHASLCPTTNFELFGRILAGKEPNTRLV